MEDCLFCKIINGQIPAHKVYEDDFVIAFLDIHPINLGHTLVIPKKHEPDFYKLDEEYYKPLMSVVKKVANKINNALIPKKVGLLVAGWDVPHAHIHVVPMEDYHDITSKRLLDENKLTPSQEELNTMAEKIKF